MRTASDPYFTVDPYYKGNTRRLFGEPIPDGVYDISTSQNWDGMKYHTQINWKAHGVQHSMDIPEEGVIAILVAMRLTAA